MLSRLYPPPHISKYNQKVAAEGDDQLQQQLQALVCRICEKSSFKSLLTTTTAAATVSTTISFGLQN